jgi:nucleotide-binding universal stress UspA family protein/predicted transcriptional regulator
MPYPYRRILCPVDFDDNSIFALETAAMMAREHDGTVFALHVVPMYIPPTGMPVYVDLYKGQEQTGRERLQQIARNHLAGLKYDLMTHIGEPGSAILQVQRKVAADVIVMATHGRRGFSRFLLGSVAENIIREASCPVLTVKYEAGTASKVGAWMTHNPVTASPDEVLSSVDDKMHAGGFRCVPIVSGGVAVGIITERDVRQHMAVLDQVEAFKVMSEGLITVAPTTDIRDAARLLRERKVGALPVIDDGKLVGVVTTCDVLDALTHWTDRAAQPGA